MALLTPGQNSYRDFEDAYLARYLGFTLVQGRDLAVRGSRLNLKTLGGLLPIEVLWRHISDRKCDPLELDPDSPEGVAGLLQAVRGGDVAIANSIGSVLAQVPALMPFLQSASQFFFGETLLLPSIATYWCGGKKECDYVLSHLEELNIRPAFSVTRDPPIIPTELTNDEKQKLVESILAKPHRFIAQSRISHSTTPVWKNGKLVPWFMTLRCFQLQTSNDIEVLPGGLSRLSPSENELATSALNGQLTQDCWFSAPEPLENEKTLLPLGTARVTITRMSDELPSRVAEHLFWLGRYAERGESITRLLRATLTCLAGESEIDELPQMPRLIASLAAAGQIEPAYAISGLDGTLPPTDKMLLESIFDLTQPRGLQSSVQSMVANATAVRDRLSIDAYRIVQRIQSDVSEKEQEHPFALQPSTNVSKLSETDGIAVSNHDIGTSIERLNYLTTNFLAFAGIVFESTTRTHGWRFIELGRRIERCVQTAELLHTTLVAPSMSENAVFEAVLQATDSLMTYRSRYINVLMPAPTIDLLVTDETNPRSLHFQLGQITKMLGKLPTDTSRVGLGADEKLARQLEFILQTADPEDLAKVDVSGARETLRKLLRELIDGLPDLSDRIVARYLIHTGGRPQLTGDTPPFFSTG